MSYDFNENEKTCSHCGLYLRNGLCSNCSSEEKEDKEEKEENLTYNAKISPITSIWFNPRRTMQFLENENKIVVGFLIILFVSFIKTVNLAVYFELGEKLTIPGIIVLCFCLAIMKAIFIYTLVSRVLFKSCLAFGGNASLPSIKKVIAWSSIPIVFSFLIWLPEFAIIGNSFFKSNSSLIDTNFVINLVYISLTIVDYILALWSLILFIICLAEVNQFGIKQSIFSSIIALIVFIIPGILFSVIFYGVNEYLQFSF